MPPDCHAVRRRPGVLVVEEAEEVRRLLGAALPGYGLDVWLAGGCEEAVRLYERHRAGIGVVLLDVGRNGTDGPRTLATLRQADPGVRAVFMRGNVAGHTAEGLRRLGVAAVVDKPFGGVANLAALLHLVAGGG
jgi:CheY-like chemotaxis protein